MNRSQVAHIRLSLATAANWAQGAYDEADPDMSWSCHTSHGILRWHPEDAHLIVAIAGSDDRLDWMFNLNTTPRTLKEWGKIAGIEVAPDSESVISTEGYLDHAANSYEGITRKLWDQGVDPAQVVSATLVGHSVGGAIAYLLQHTQTFNEAKAFVYGCPKVFKDQVPSRIRYSCWRVHDPVPYFPLSCKHPSQQYFLLSRPGTVPRTKVPAMSRVTMGIWVAVAWCYGLWATAKRRFMPDGSRLETWFNGHPMRDYARILKYRDEHEI